MISIHTARAGDCVRLPRLGTLLFMIAISILGFSAGARAALAGDLDTISSFDIPAEPLDKALLQFGVQARLQIMFAPNTKIALARTKQVIGRYTGRSVLVSLLRGTGLGYTSNQNTVSVEPLKSSVGVAADPVNDASPVAGVDAQSSGEVSQSSTGTDKAVKKQEGAQLQVITITGTHINSATGSILATQTFTQADMDRSGQGSVADFLQTLPENFSGGMSTNTDGDFAGGTAAGEDATYGTGVNLRGLGNDATLVLLDGHRIAPADVFGNFVDLSLFPEDAVGKIDVVTDGASAIYGSDAVGGVVNITPRQNFDGVETRVRFGADTHNDVHQSEIGQTLGRTWDSGSALLAYELYDETPLSAADRDFTASAPLPFSLIPEQVRQSALASLKQTLTENVLLYSDVYFSHRSTNSYDTIASISAQHNWSVANSYGAILGVRYALSDTTELDVSGDYSVGSAGAEEFELPKPTDPIYSQKAKSILSTEEAVLNGSLLSLPTGQILYAVGAQFRNEAYELTDNVAHSLFAPTRDVSSGFAELRIPVLGSIQNSDGPSALELSLADREDDYSDAGATNNQTVGLLWVPAVPLKVTATYGTSFVAPLLNYTNPAVSEVAVYNTSQVPGSAPPDSAPFNVLTEFGGTANLKPQTATTWTLGTAWNSPGSTGVRARLNYYRIRFDDRINSLESAGINPFYAVPEASYLGPQIVQFNPPAALVQQLESSPAFVNFGAPDPSDIGALVDAKYLNLSKVDTDGLDIGFADRLEEGRTTLEPGIDATVVFHLDTQFTSSSPPTEILNTLYNPTRTKLRGHLLVSQSAFSVEGFVNFVNAYTDNTTPPYTRISSWTTFDMTASYSCSVCAGILPDVTGTLGVLNIFNRAPPYAANGDGFAINYDGANANALGRFISLTLAIHW